MQRFPLGPPATTDDVDHRTDRRSEAERTRRRALVRRFVLTFVLVWLADRHVPTSWAEPRIPGTFRSAQALVPAVRHSMFAPATVTATAHSVPASIRTETHRSTIGFNGCTANIIRDDRGRVLGFVGAAHCVKPTSNTMRYVAVSANGIDSPIDRSMILMDTTTDMFYVGLEGHVATDVWHQVRMNFTRSDIEDQPSTTVLVMTGYPWHHNPRREAVTLSLTLGGIVRWPNDPTDTIATFGDWNALQQTCSPGASGAGLYHFIAGVGWVVIAVLASRAEFEGVQTMPYHPDYGLELRSFFEKQLAMTIDADYMCGFAPPSPLPRPASSPSDSVATSTSGRATSTHVAATA